MPDVYRSQQCSHWSISKTAKLFPGFRVAELAALISQEVIQGLPSFQERGHKFPCSQEWPSFWDFSGFQG
jgi:hypothetical protein